MAQFADIRKLGRLFDLNCQLHCATGVRSSREMVTVPKLKSRVVLPPYSSAGAVMLNRWNDAISRPTSMPPVEAGQLLQGKHCAPYEDYLPFIFLSVTQSARENH